ncbi:MAG: helix-turn-helix transcriptional regulator [Acidobacteriaceae bacterium]|nr:helix-turn-helix transcriptional regulator [Acidobacteriaceae bacterium]
MTQTARSQDVREILSVQSLPLAGYRYIAARYSERRYNAFVPDSRLTSQAFHVLIALAGRDQHGYGIMQDVASRTQGKIRLGAGTLYGLIKRLLEDGLIVEVPETKRPPKSEDDGRRRYYRLTPHGRRTAQAEAARLNELLEQARAHGLVAKSN